MTKRTKMKYQVMGTVQISKLSQQTIYRISRDSVAIKMLWLHLIQQKQDWVLLAASHELVPVICEEMICKCVSVLKKQYRPTSSKTVRRVSWTRSMFQMRISFPKRFFPGPALRENITLHLRKWPKEPLKVNEGKQIQLWGTKASSKKWFSWHRKTTYPGCYWDAIPGKQQGLRKRDSEQSLFPCTICRGFVLIAQKRTRLGLKLSLLIKSSEV